MMSPPVLRAALRRPLERMRMSSSRRLLPHPHPRPPRRYQSSDAKKEARTGTEEPVPVPVPGTAAAPLPLWRRLGPLTRAGEAYARAQRRRPWATQVASALFIYLCADVSAQRISGKEYDPKRTARNLVVGGVCAIPNYIWFVRLSTQWFNFPSQALSVSAKVVFNQLTFTPVFNTYFFGFQALLCGDTPAEIWDRITRTVPVSFVNSWKLWPAVTAFSFTFVPVEYRSVFAGVVAVGWQTYLSYLNRQAEAEEEERHNAVSVSAAKPAPVAVGS
ncbi:hypothetical protein F4779DRAFT_558869 [Xylariaceae sp. FL0662B]|nr:hypothetical protein F4779DRAFT_558869 [Xylariaceae sp. FL0662B]